jgi:hypothetical protein
MIFGGLPAAPNGIAAVPDSRLIHRVGLSASVSRNQGIRFEPPATFTAFSTTREYRPGGDPTVRLIARLRVDV